MVRSCNSLSPAGSCIGGQIAVVPEDTGNVARSDPRSRFLQGAECHSLSTPGGTTRMTGLDEFLGPNAGYVADLFDQYQHDPASVDPETRATFDAWQAKPVAAAAPAPAADALDVSAAAGAAALAQTIRLRGHRGASLDPLGSPPPGDPQLDPAYHGVDDELLERLPGRAVGG